jgi:hypothetical protein
MEVCNAFQMVHTRHVLRYYADHPDTIIRTAVTTSRGSSIRTVTPKKKMRYPCHQQTERDLSYDDVVLFTFTSLHVPYRDSAPSARRIRMRFCDSGNNLNTFRIMAKHMRNLSCV